MRAYSLSLCTSLVLLSCFAEQLSCSGESECVLATQADSVSLLQSRNIQVEHVEDIGSPGSTASLQQAPPRVKAVEPPSKAAKAVNAAEAAVPAQSPHHSATLVKNAEPAHLANQIWMQTIHSGWSIGVVTTILSGVCWLFCTGQLNLKTNREGQLEDRVMSVLLPQNAREEPERASKAASSSSFNFMVSWASLTGHSSQTCQVQVPMAKGGDADQPANAEEKKPKENELFEWLEGLKERMQASVRRCSEVQSSMLCSENVGA